MGNIIMYHGAECPHCHAMMPLVEKLEKETGIKIEKKEVWHNEKNADEMRSKQEIILETCDDLGVPCFLSKSTEKAFCGEASYEELKEWVLKNN